MTESGVSLSVIWTKEDGETAFTDRVLSFEERLGKLRLTEPLAARSLSFRWTPGSFDVDFHRSARRRLVLMLEGGIEITVSSGERRIFRQGDVFEIGDLTGKGHRSRALDGQPFRTVFIALDEDIPLDRRRPLDTLPKGAPAVLDYPRNVSTPDGGSTTLWDKMPYSFGGPEGIFTDEVPLSRFQFALAPGSFNFDWHNAPQRQVVIVLSGGLETETTDGSVARVKPGGFLYGEDTSGRGHRTVSVNGIPRLSVFAHRI